MKYDKIIIEGPNNVGKTTLIENLRQFIDYEREHVTNLCPNDREFCDDLLSSTEPLILDRLHVSEMVYSDIYKRRCKISQDEYEDLCYIHKDHVLIIILDADYDFIIRANALKKEHFDYKTVAAEKRRFYEQYLFLKDNDIPCVRIKNHWNEDLCKIVLGVIGYDFVN